MNDLLVQDKQNEIFNFNFEGHDVRSLAIDGEPWFVGKDVAEALGYADPSSAISKNVDTEDKTTLLLEQDGSNYKSKTTIISESGLYVLIFGSKLESAKRFKRWVTKEVLPSIRKNGGYIYGQENMSEEELISRALILANSKIVALETKNEELVDENISNGSIIDLMSGSKEKWLTTEIAQYYGMSAYKFNKLLESLNIQHKEGKVWYINNEYLLDGYMVSAFKNFYEDKQLVERIKFSTWTKDGVKFIYNKLKEVDILPVMERNIRNEMSL